MDRNMKNKGAISKPRRSSRPDAPIYVPPAIRKAQQPSLPVNLNSIKIKKDIGQNIENIKKQLPNITHSSSKANLPKTQICKTIEFEMLSNLDNRQSKHSIAKSSSVPNIHIECKNEHEVPELFVINAPATSVCTNKTDSKSIVSNEDLICKEDICTKEIQEIYATNTIEDTQGNSSGSVQVDTSNQTNVNSEIHSENTEMVSWIDKNKDHEQEELLRASEVINRRNKRIMKQSFNTSDVLIISDSNVRNNNVHEQELKPKRLSVNIVADKEAPVECWEDLLNENEQMHTGIMLKMSENVGNMNVSPITDNIHSKDILEGELCHVVEIYDFPKEFQTRDLVSILDSFKCTNYHIKWVDDNHALAVFTSGFAAGEFVKVKHPLIKIRSFAEASEQSISKAKRYPNAMMPFVSRPLTCPQTARRMVSGALGLKLENAKEERAKEIKILKEAREKKKLNLKLQDEAWEGKLPSK